MSPQGLDARVSFNKIREVITMIHYLYTIRDMIAEECGPVFNAKNDSVAIRQVHNLIRNEPCGDPSEYELYRIGQYDGDTGRIVSIEPDIVDFKLSFKRGGIDE